MRPVSRLPLLAGLIPLGYLPGYLAGSRPDVAGSAAIVIATLGAWLILDRAPDRLAPWGERRAAALAAGQPLPPGPGPLAARLALALALVAFVVAVSAGSIARVESFGRKEAFSVGIFQQAFWYTDRWFAGHGVPMGVTYSTRDASLHSQFGIHFSPLLMALAPIYRLRPQASTLLVLQALALGLAALPLAALTRRKLGPLGAAGVGVAWLLHPTVLGAPLNGFHDMAFAPVFLFLAFWALEGRRLGWFVAALLALVGVREDLAFAVLLMAPLAAWRGAPPAFALTPALLGLGWLGVSLGLVIPAHRTPELLAMPSVFFHQYLGSLGDTPGAVVKTLVTHPLVPLRRLLSREGVLYLLAVLRPLGLLLPLPSPAWLVALQPLTLNLLSDGGALRMPLARYSLPVVAAFFAALPGGIRFWVTRLEPGAAATLPPGSPTGPDAPRLPTELTHAGRAAAARVVGLLLVSAALALVLTRLDQQFKAAPREDLAQQRARVAAIADTGAVLAPDWAYARLANRARYACLGSLETRALDPEVLGRFRWVLLDLAPDSFELKRYPELLPNLMDNLLLNNNFEKIGGGGPIYLFRRRDAVSAPPPPPSGR